jgi:sugar phosphate isomerase/epimerase
VKEVPMPLSMTTDYVKYTGDPFPGIRKIARAGFSHIHWCHEWCTAHVYNSLEIETIQRELGILGVKLLDLHAPHGMGWGWGSAQEEERQSALALIGNRIEMTGSLGGGAVVVHLPRKPADPGQADSWRASLRRSLETLAPVSERAGVTVALENMPDDDFDEIGALFGEFPPEFLGLCYDSGHGNMGRDGLEGLEKLSHRLVSVHLHDNDGLADAHSLPFRGTVDWERLAGCMASSSYGGCVSLESNMRGMDVTEDRYLADAFSAASRLADMIDGRRGDSRTL